MKRVSVAFVAEVSDEEALRIQKHPSDEVHLTYLRLVPAYVELNGRGRVLVEDVEEENAA